MARQDNRFAVVNVDIKYLGFVPDLDPSTEGALVGTAALVPTSRGFFKPVRLPQIYTALPLSSACYGTFYALYLNGTEALFAGTNNHLYKGDLAAWTAWDGGTTFTTPTTLPGGGWRFCQFGNDTIAVNGSNTDVPQVSALAANFGTLGGSPPVTKLVASVANAFVFMANTITQQGGGAGFGDQWWCSGLGNDATWVASLATQATNGRLFDTAGPISAVKSIGANITVAIYKQTATYLGQYVGPPLIWQFIRVNSLNGALTHESVVDIGNIHVFPSMDDFYTFDGSSLQRLENPVKQWFFGQLNMAAIRTGTANIFGTLDRINDIVYWYFPTTTTAADTWLAWNIKSNKWTKGVLTVEAVMVPDVVLNNLPTTAVFKTDHKFYSINGGPDATCTLTTGDIGDHTLFYDINRIRPKFATAPADPTSVTVTGYRRFSLGDVQQQVTGPSPMGAYGWVNLRTSARWSAFKLALAQDMEIIGMDVYATPVGDR